MQNVAGKQDTAQFHVYYGTVNVYTTRIIYLYLSLTIIYSMNGVDLRKLYILHQGKPPSNVTG